MRGVTWVSREGCISEGRPPAAFARDALRLRTHGDGQRRYTSIWFELKYPPFNCVSDRSGKQRRPPVRAPRFRRVRRQMALRDAIGDVIAIRFRFRYREETKCHRRRWKPPRLPASSSSSPCWSSSGCCSCSPRCSNPFRDDRDRTRFPHRRVYHESHPHISNLLSV